MVSRELRIGKREKKIEMSFYPKIEMKNYTT